MMYPKLLKIYLKNTFSKNSFGNTKTKKFLFIFMMLYVLISVGSVLGFMFFSLGSMLNTMDQMDVMITFLGVYVLVIPIFMTLFRASGTLFYYKDFSIVGPLPIKSSTVFLAKISEMMLWIYAASLLFVTPIILTYFNFEGFNVLTLVMMVIGLLALPMIPIVFMSFISLLLGYISAKTRLGIVFQTIITFGLLIGVMLIQFGFNNNDVNPLGGQVNLMVLLQDYYVPLKWFQEAVVNHSILGLIYLVLANIIIFIVSIFMFEKLSLKINKTSIKRKSYRNKSVVIQSQPIVKTLIKKEFNKFFSMPAYMINIGFGLILMLIGAFASILFKTDILSAISTLDIEPILILSVAMGFMVVLTFSPAVSLSLEGKHFWILRSLPIAPKTVMFSKIAFNVLLVLPVSIVSILLFSTALELGVIHTLLLILIITSINILSSHLNGMFNLFFPKFDFDNETMVIKQSVSALLATFGGIALVTTNGALYFLFSWLSNMEFALLIVSAFNLMFASLAAMFLYKSAEKQFRKY